MKYLIILFSVSFINLNVAAQILYSLKYDDSSSGRVKISIQLTKEKKSPVRFIMPRSVPGAYGVLNYDGFIESLTAISNKGDKIAMVKDSRGAPRWNLADTNQAIVRIEYEVNMRKMEERMAPSDASISRSGFAGILNYSVFGWIEGTELDPIQCTIQTYTPWPIFSTNQPTAGGSKGALSFKTDNYYTLADGQIFMGPRLRVKEFKGMVPLFVASYCETRDEYLDDYGRQGTMCLEILKNYFGELPFKEYSILLRKALPPDGHSVMPFGMEHLQSSTFFGDTTGLRVKAMSEQDITQTMATYLHHMGHAFIPLRCYGDAYLPIVKEIPPIINNIWFNEGFMWFVPFEELKLEGMKRRFNANTYGADDLINKMSLQELSQQASLMYSEDFRLGMAVYSRGAMMAIDMNNYLREKTDGNKSMKTVLRYLYYWSKKNKRAFTLEEFPSLINEACGIDLSAIYKKWQLPIE